MATADATQVAGRPLRREWSLGPRLTGLLSFIGFILLWQSIIWITRINPILLPSPGEVVSEFGAIWQEGILWPTIVESLQPLAVGLIAGLVLGVLLGLLIGSSAWLDLLAAPYLWAFFATPRIATVPVILSCKEGVQTVDTSLVNAARSFGANRLDLFRHVVVPYTLPFIANGVRNGIARGFVGLLIIEMTVGSGGIGRAVIKAMGQFNTARMFAFIAILVVTALVLITLSRRFEAYASRWREEVYV
ncbi:MAG TPA: ABC transporter permease subunit [Actinomycetota bacterium]|nr:ABC transporter permease subunit [Actinomycetota bacterium]